MPVCLQCGTENPTGAKFCNECAAPFVAALSREQRKVVTVLFCDVVGSTSLGESTDPEALRTLLASYFERMKETVERHGGSVEKFIGDAVMAVFGVPVVHEDDALRAVRAAVEMRAAFPELGIEGRIGITTGEVVTGTEERLATGDAVNVAARLEQAAQPGEILIGEETLRLTRDAVEVGESRLLELKGKAKPVPAHRVVSVSGEAGLTRRLDAPMVGREREKRLLESAWERLASERSCHLFTILGPAGVGKSRLTAEFLGSLEDALVARGRCLPYGEGITYWPVVEVLKQLPEVDTDPVAVSTIRGLLGDTEIATSSEEIAWAFRKRLEAVAAEGPLVCVFDDVHWGEETFLDLVEHVADLSRDAPILLLCMSRPDLLDRRTGWGGGKVNATTVLLEPLGPEETDLLIRRLKDLDEGLRERIREAAEGNPLFVEEMVALAQASGGGDVVVPPTIQALLAARLDQLDGSERSVLERGAVEGRVFHRGAVQALTPEDTQVSARLTSLVRKELVRPDKPQLPGEDAFRFRHLLIRDAAYDALPKATRAELHERFAVWLEEHGADLVELDEILGYHLEQAYRHRLELGIEDRTLGRHAARRLVLAGRRAHLLGDVVATVKLLDRARELTPPKEREVMLDVELGEALWSAGRLSEAETVFNEAAAYAAARGDRQGKLRALLARAMLGLLTSPGEGKADQLLALGKEAIDVFRECADEAGLARAWEAIGEVENMRCQFRAEAAAFEQAMVHAKRTGDERLTGLMAARIVHCNFWGPTPVEEALSWLDEHHELVQIRPGIGPLARGLLKAMQGHFDAARSLIAEARARNEELGARMMIANAEEGRCWVELWAGDPGGAERVIRRACELLEEMGEKASLSTRGAVLAQVLCALKRFDEAEEWSRTSEELAPSDDIATQMLWRRARARVLAHRGELTKAERLMREALALLEQTDALNEQAEARMDLAEVLEVGGKTKEAFTALEQALGLYERKGNVVMAERMRARLAELGGSDGSN
ncbi:MAG: adenylate/guanylate cyclase domain-containing protein [Candidatus Rokuibacteriota bacterium]|nr:MAG: adenylate/guanylate cyclase domain-containing protein [Candidatus Rokubacteria bacterium]